MAGTNTDNRYAYGNPGDRDQEMQDLLARQDLIFKIASRAAVVGVFMLLFLLAMTRAKGAEPPPLKATFPTEPPPIKGFIPEKPKEQAFEYVLPSSGDTCENGQCAPQQSAPLFRFFRRR